MNLTEILMQILGHKGKSPVDQWVMGSQAPANRIIGAAGGALGGPYGNILNLLQGLIK